MTGPRQEPPGDPLPEYTLPSPGIPKVRSEMRIVTVGAGSGPGVIVMHEAGGMSSHCLKLAGDLASSGFRVFLPLLFGEPGQDKAVDARGLFCIRKEMHFLASNRTSPIAELIRSLIHDVSARTNGKRVGVIGMCLTGGLVLALMAEAEVGAAVASQPSLPLPVLGRWTPGYKQSALGSDSADLVEAVRSGTPLLALRFAEDWICPPQRFDALSRTFGRDGALTCEVVPGKGHSVLTVDRPDGDGDPVRLVRDFLIRHLTGEESDGGPVDPSN